MEYMLPGFYAEPRAILVDAVMQKYIVYIKKQKVTKK